MNRISSFPPVEIVNAKPEPIFTVDEIIEKMIEMYGEKVADPEVYPRILKFQFLMAKLALEASHKTSNVILNAN